MQFRFSILLVWFCACASLTGCYKDNIWTFRKDKSYKDHIQDQVVDKLGQQSQQQGGKERLAEYNRDSYQDPAAARPGSQWAEIQEKRHLLAKKLLAAGPLSLDDCLACSLELNDKIQASRSVVRSMTGEEIIANSRYLPKLAVDLSSTTAGQSFIRDMTGGGSALATLLQLGKDDPIDINLRDQQRLALFGYEQDVANVLSQVRLKFFTVLLKQQQLGQRQKLRQEFQARYERMQRLEAVKRVVHLDVLTARLNVLNEDSNINSLQKEIVRQKLDLLYAMGMPMTQPEFALQGKIEAFPLTVEQSVALAFGRSTGIAQSRAAVFEQDRLTRQIVWEYLPWMDVQGGYMRSKWTAGMAAYNETGLFSTSPFAVRPVDYWSNGGWASPDFTHYDDVRGWYMAADLRFPIFSGLERTGNFLKQKALLDSFRYQLSDTVSATDLDVRKAFQTVLEQAQAVAILQGVVAISKERLQLQERLKELGKISDNELETFRERFFEDQDRYFISQLSLVEAQERLRLKMRYFESAPPGKDGTYATK